MEKTFKTLDEQINILIDKGLTINDIDKAIENVKKAMEINPENERIKNNYEIMKSAKNS